ncbi:MAG: class II fructose-bisphosphatase [Chloroflexi bacterium]|nr:class II fructose-bisphosphatase [Chloroflexota bacterium]MBT4004280.1 class II fructose-bisphosphatase [Chloroflexota bacterium]MBT4305723.1 class II fructose-bisphosphatase [Chloroflexota bacterium]MBT4533547.1 class II fructose-bisphosphatase [Chloroflexota bacterium]MBT4681810.1 class II fructose-bisphosphatase [Chloroflexota bacterium]
MKSSNSKPSRNLAMDLVRVTEAAALLAARYMGRDDKEAADQAAVDGMRELLNSIEMEATVVIGEGEKDEAPMLFNGEVLGLGGFPKLDLAADPIDGTRPLAQGRPNSIATVSAAPRGTMFDPGPFMYMDKIAVGPSCRGLINIEKPVEENLKIIAKAKGIRPQDLTVVVLDRPRHVELVKKIRGFGARIRFIDDGDVAGALMTSLPESGIDVLIGVGGTPEGVLAACALRAMGGEIQGKLFARNDDELKAGIEMGYDFEKVLTMDDLVASDDVFFAATGITDGELLDGVKYYSHGARTESIVVRGITGTVRTIIANHSFEQLDAISTLQY